MWQLESRFLKTFVGKDEDLFANSINGKKMKKKKKKKKTGPYNVFEAKPDFENCNGRSITVNKHDLQILEGSNIGIFLVNLRKGSMMAPHWNPMACEISIVLHGEGMIRVAGSSNERDGECMNTRFMVEEGDLFVVYRFRPMVQMSFNNDSLVFIGFSTSMMTNYPQFLAGKKSVLQVLDRGIVASSFNVSNRTVDRLLAPQEEAAILDCTSCAEVELVKLKEEIEKEREEERQRRRKEEERKQREEEERKRREEEDKRREEEEKHREEEERQRKEEEEKRREEEERKHREEEEEKRRKEEEEEWRRRQEEEKRWEEEEMKRRQEEEEVRKREEEEAKRQEDKRWSEEEEEAPKRQEEERQRRVEEEEEKEKEVKEAEREWEQPPPGESERERKGGGGPMVSKKLGFDEP